jgi:UDP-N-acetylmuramate: L-alanyl-gamma-D-glutamyl-meso-diaminopimelate ligase
MHIHILGICGTFMSGIAIIAKQQGHHVTGSDETVYPPMSTQLVAQGITLMQGYDPAHLQPQPDCVIIGNAMKRGNPEVEYVLVNNLPYISGPQWLAEQVLAKRWVLAVAGTHGKTTTASMLAWILDYSGLPTGFLIGGIPSNFGVSARYTDVPFFVIEGDEYDSAFFDKRSKFMHFHPRTLVLNSLEFDHADIFTSLEDIKRQFQYLIRTVPGNGLIIHHGDDENLKDVLQRGIWTPVQTFASKDATWQARNVQPDGGRFSVYYQDALVGQVNWSLLGMHNVNNALAAIAGAHHAGVSPQQAIYALNHFQGVKRRLELRGQVQGISLYDDFAHHPTAIATTLEGLRAKVGQARIIVLAEFASYTMRVGYHREHLAESFKDANYVVFLQPKIQWNMEELLAELPMPAKVHNNVDDIINDVIQHVQSGDHIVVMSNRSFGSIHEKLLRTLQSANITEKANPMFG